MAVSIILLIFLLIGSLIGVFGFLLPERRAARLSPFWHRVRDFLMMKKLYLESILRTLYVLATVTTFVLCVAGGLLSPFLLPGDRNFGQVLLSLVLGLICGVILAVILLFIARIFYENIMLNISLTDAAKKINLKLGSDERSAYEEPRRRPAPPKPVVCRNCGTRFDPRRGYCPNCDRRW